MNWAKMNKAHQYTLTHPNDTLISYGASGKKHFKEFCQNVHTVKQNLLGLKKVGLFSSDSYQFAVIFFACLSQKIDVVMPNNDSPGRLEELKDVVEKVFNNDTSLFKQQKPTETTLEPLTLDLTTEVSLLTSGSSGKPKTVNKVAQQLFSEAETLDTHFQPAPAPTYSTVPHYHIYGLLFKIIWPLIKGRAFNRECQFGLDDFQSMIHNMDTCNLVSCPAHLERLPNYLSQQINALPFKSIFSSGGSCSEQTLKRWDNQGCQIDEVFGSTESGGVAFRKNGHTNPQWHTLPNVECRENNGFLEVKSPFTGLHDWLPMNDKVTFIKNTQQFIFEGRSDRIVKIKEKRISLIEMESKLKDMSDIDDAYILNRQHHEGPILSAVVKLSQSATLEYYQLGHRVFFQNIRKKLSDYFENVSLPKNWRATSSIPINSMGKITQEAIDYLFQTPFTTTKTKPYVLKIDKKNHVDLKLELPYQLDYFKGHFPNFPILAGVVQVDWADHYFKQLISCEQQLSRILKLKFKSILLPGQKVNLRLEYNQVKNQVSFKYYHEEHLYSSGILCFSMNP